ILLACWSAGVTVLSTPAPAEVGFATPERAAELDQPQRYLVGLHGLGLPLRNVPEGYLDYAVDVRGYGDRFTPPPGVPDHDDMLAAATARAEELEIEPGDRVLIDAARYPDPLAWLLAPLAVARSTGVPVRIFFTGTSSFFADSVRGTARTWWISSGTCRGDSAVRSSRAIRARSSSSSSRPLASTTNSSSSPAPPSASSR